MRIGDILYFSPGYRFTDLKWDDKDNLIGAFQDRVKEFYIKPARMLNEKRQAFAAGILCVATIDFIARIETGLDRVGERFEKWLRNNIKEFDQPNPDSRSQTLAYRFYDEFRNGLVHEGRVKNAGQFSYDFGELVKIIQVNTKSIMIINPDYLLSTISSLFKKYIERIKNEELAFQEFKCALLRDFREDVEHANR